MTGKTKAYKYTNYEGGTIIFFETSAGKARQHAFLSDVCTEDSYTDVKVKRFPQFDYMDKPEGYELDWNNPEEREAIFRIGGLMCDPDFFDPEECERCCVSKDCDVLRDYWEDN